MSLDHAGWARLYRVLSGLGLGEPQVPVELVDEDGVKTGHTLPLGWRPIKVAIHFDHDDIAPFLKDDWTLIPLTSSSAKALAQGLQFIDEVLFAYTLRESESSATQTVSRHERALLAGLLRAGLPEPDRNLRIRRKDGSTLTVPDFAWEDRMLAVFLDGHHWHGGRSLDDLMRQVASADGKPDPQRRKAVQQRWRNKAAADAERRRQMTAAGWTVLAVSDADIDPDDAASVEPMVADIVSTWSRLEPQTAVGAG